MRSWDAQRIANASGSELLRGAGGPGPQRACIDSRLSGPGDLFVGLRGEHADGGEHAAGALAAGAWGVLVEPEHAAAAAREGAKGVVLQHADPLAGMQALARQWRRELGARGARVIAVTGSTGKTSTKDILAALLSPTLRVSSTPQNLNTEIGLPLVVLSAPGDTQVLVLEMAMRGAGQIAELAAIAEPDVGVIVNIGPAHLELLGSLEAIAAAKAELIAGLAAGAVAVVPAREPLLEPHMRADIRMITFGPGGDATLERERAAVTVRMDGERIELKPSFDQAHQLSNLLAAVAAARAAGLRVGGEVNVGFSQMRGERSLLSGEVVLIDDCYNANPMSMAAAIDELARAGGVRTVAILGDMLELGPAGPRLHRQVGERARQSGVEVLLAVGELAGEIASGYGDGALAAPDSAAAAVLAPTLVRPGDAVLVKGSRGMAMERVAEALRDAPWAAGNSDHAPAGRR